MKKFKISVQIKGGNFHGIETFGRQSCSADGKS